MPYVKLDRIEYFQIIKQYSTGNDINFTYKIVKYYYEKGTKFDKGKLIER